MPSTSTDLAAKLHALAAMANDLADQAQNAGLGATGQQGFFITGLTVFVLACFVGYYVVWRVTPALHAPLMAVTNAISSVIIIGALLAAGPEAMTHAKMLGLAAIFLASVNIFGGFTIAERMLGMFRGQKAEGSNQMSGRKVC